MADIKFGLFVTGTSANSQGSALEQISNALSRIEGAIDSVWFIDHFAVLECWTLTSYLAATFPNLDVGTIVLRQSCRNPALVAKMAATLQLLTGGRFILGIGAGGLEAEYLAYGYEFPRLSVRIRQLEEAVQIIRRMWTETPASFQGEYYQIENAYCEPMPEPQIPIMIGAKGEQLSLKVVAKHADWWNADWCDPPTYARKLDVLRQHCKTVGRDCDSIVKTWNGKFSIAETEAEAQHLAEDWQGRVNGVGTPEQVAGLELFAEKVIPQFR